MRRVYSSMSLFLQRRIPHQSVPRHAGSSLPSSYLITVVEPWGPQGICPYERATQASRRDVALHIVRNRSVSWLSRRFRSEALT